MSTSKAECLRTHYLEAFEEWLRQVKRLHAEIESASVGGADIGVAQERAAAAEVAYRESRDLLTDEMMHHSSKDARGDCRPF